MIEQRAALEGRDHPGEQANDAGKEQCRQGQLKGCREQCEELGPDAFTGTQRLAKIALGQLADIVQVLLWQWLVQTQALHGLGVHFRVNPAFAHHDFHRVTGYQPYERERQQGDAEKGRDQ
ncbi:hypothetical protein D3C80_692930 [compost metagenome]